LYASKLLAGAAFQSRIALESASERAGPPRRTITYCELPDPPEPEPPELEPLPPDEPAPLPPDEPEPSPPGERPVVEPAAAPFVTLVGGLPETLSFLATFFFAFFDFTLVECVSVLLDSDVSFAATVLCDLVDFAAVSCVAMVERSLPAWRLSACLSSLASAVVASDECNAVGDVPVPATVALPLLYVPVVLFEFILALVPGEVPLLSLYELPCGFCVLALTVGDALGGTVLEAAGSPAFIAPAVELSLLPTGVAWFVVLVDIDEVVLASGAFLDLCMSPIANALPAAKASIELVRKRGASLRMMELLCGVGWMFEVRLESKLQYVCHVEDAHSAPVRKVGGVSYANRDKKCRREIATAS
jgi:hypothetical protein